ncbi:DUF4931 domain-containing protein [Companilactobacillus keshanensis]|uniref:DUF4931 domain-containing protein n=1 Tax=Companilactobacillus keshanensis TaxID=2486003 RepID=A0ABW4BWN2_9LACO|nr:DUF4931 domain-containing protein [Companilactobacillus keshanensis]
MQEQIKFIVSNAKGKPENIVHENNYCPFCDVKSLTNIFKYEGDRIWLMNKFRVLADTMQTVLIESSDHNGDWSNYSSKNGEEIMEFALRCFDEMIEDPKYKSTIMYKNFGPHSGGSLLHPHMQIIGLDNVDAYSHIHVNNFAGHDYLKIGNAELNISTEPILSFLEFNIRIKDISDAKSMSNSVRMLTNYILHKFFNGKFDSYNLFFYHINNEIICKMIPRTSTSPIVMGYKMPQVDNLEQIQKVEKEIIDFNAGFNSGF